MTWNPWGIVSDGLLMEPRISEQYTVEIEFSSLPTPTCFDAMGAAINPASHLYPNLKTIIARELLPTPTSSEHKYRLKGQSQQSKCLEAKARRGDFEETNMLATPTASQNYKAVRPLSPSEANGTHGKTLVGDIGNQLGVEIGESGESAPRLGLNPEFVEAMMGFPTGWTDLRL